MRLVPRASPNSITAVVFNPDNPWLGKLRNLIIMYLLKINVFDLFVRDYIYVLYKPYIVTSKIQKKKKRKNVKRR